jgi:hypothetical protein
MTRYRAGSRARLVRLLFSCVALAIAGCGRAPVPQNPAPFQAAVERYLQQNSMALRIKEVEQGPVITGDRATMTVSLTHAELGGPSVVWVFDFTQRSGGDWDAVRRAE